MDFAFGGNGSDDEVSSNPRKGKKEFYRHSAEHVKHLEEFFKDCPHPNENQRKQLSWDLGLDPNRIKFWFQNKRNQVKTQNERAENNALRAENERINLENLMMRERLMNPFCSKCEGLTIGHDARQLHLHNLAVENARLKQEWERLTHFMASLPRGPGM